MTYNKQSLLKAIAFPLYYFRYEIGIATIVLMLIAEGLK